MKSYQLLSLAAIMACGISAYAQSPAGYQIQVARTQGSLNCSINIQTKAADCTMTITEDTKLPINMIATDKGFAGVDKLSTGNSGDQFVFAVIADANKNVTGAALVRGQSSGDANFDGEVSAFASSKPDAVNVYPLHVSQTDAQTVEVQMSFLAYGQNSDNVSLSSVHQALTDKILQKVKPMVLSATK